MTTSWSYWRYWKEIHAKMTVPNLLWTISHLSSEGVSKLADGQRRRLDMASLDEGIPYKIHDKKWELWHVQFLGSERMAITYSYRASARLRMLDLTFSFACDAAPLKQTCQRFWENVLTKRSNNSRAKHELVSSKNRVLMHESQRK